MTEGKLLDQDENGQWWLKVPVSRLSAALIAWLLVVLGITDKISTLTVSRWLKAEKIKPWLFRSWITPKNLDVFLPRAKAVLDLYQRVPHLRQHESAWCLDEKTSIQARSRECQVPCGPGSIARVENIYGRQGAAQLLAGLNIATGAVCGVVHTNKTFNQFKELIFAIVQECLKAGKTLIHLVLDNGSCHRPKYLEQWLEETFTNVEFKVYWLPVHSSWLNQIEIYFSRLQQSALTPNNFSSLGDLVDRIVSFLAMTNLNPAPIIWTYTAAQLFRKFGRMVDRIW